MCVHIYILYPLSFRTDIKFIAHVRVLGRTIKTLLARVYVSKGIRHRCLVTRNARGVRSRACMRVQKFRTYYAERRDDVVA